MPRVDGVNNPDGKQRCFDKPLLGFTGALEGQQTAVDNGTVLKSQTHWRCALDSSQVRICSCTNRNRTVARSPSFVMSHGPGLVSEYGVTLTLKVFSDHYVPVRKLGRQTIRYVGT